MKVDSVEPTINSIPTVNTSSARAANCKRPEAPSKSAKAESTDQNNTNVETESPTEERGVIRLLEEGHFKGVSDVRLRINFFDELASRANAAAASSVSTGSGEFVESVSSEVQGLLDELSPDEDTQQAAQTALEEYQQAVQQAITESTSNGIVDRDALENSVRSAFDTLITELRTLLTPPAPEEEVVEPPADETDETGEIDETNETGETDETIVDGDNNDDTTGDETGSTVDLEAALGSLTQTFEDALSRLLESADLTSNLPPLSTPPSSQGKAYDKFLAIYEALLQGKTESPTDPLEEPPVDTNNDEPIDVIV